MGATKGRQRRQFDKGDAVTQSLDKHSVQQRFARPTIAPPPASRVVRGFATIQLASAIISMADMRPPECESDGGVAERPLSG